MVVYLCFMDELLKRICPHFLSQFNFVIYIIHNV